MAKKPPLKICNIIYIMQSDKDSLPYIILLGGFIYMTLAIYAMSTSTMLSLYFYSYLALLIIPLILIFIVVTKISIYTLGGITAIMLIIVATIFAIKYIQSQTTAAAGIINFIIAVIMVVIIIVALAIFYNMFINSLKRMDGISGFIVNFIFYIPCLLNDLIIYLFNQYKITPNIVFILFVLEIALILLVIYIPYLINKVRLSNGVTILNDPVFLNKSVIMNIDPVSTAIQPRTPTNELTTTPPTYSNNYTISMWIYLNPAELTTKEVTIFEYSQNTAYTTQNSQDLASAVSGSIGYNAGSLLFFPKITYVNGHYNIYNGANVDMSFNLIGQTWNYFVFNHNADNTVDLFINGKLEKSSNPFYQLNYRGTGTTQHISYTETYDKDIDASQTYDADGNTIQTAVPDYNIATISSPAKMTTGQDDGLYGAICNIMYYITPLTAREIITTYNLLMFKNPPVN